MTMVHAPAVATVSDPVGDVLRVVGLTKRFGATPAADNVNLTVEAGEFAAILGPSGCGKSTLLGIVGGFVPADSGDILIGNRSIAALPPERRPTAMVFQTLALFPHMTVLANIAFGMKSRGRSRAAVRRRVAELLELVQMSEMAGRRISQLSGGQRQRVAIARALAVEPAILLLDEPLSALDAQMRQSMQRELRSIQQRTGTTFVYVTHDQNEAVSMADRLVVMRGGRIEQQGAPQQVYARPETDFVARFLGNANVVSATVNQGHHELIDLLGANIASGSDTWAIRPESVRLVDPTDSVAQVRGVITRVTFYGQLLRYEIDIGLPDPLVAMRPIDETAREVRQTVGVVVDLARAVPVRRSGS